MPNQQLELDRRGRGGDSQHIKSRFRRNPGLVCTYQHRGGIRRAHAQEQIVRGFPYIQAARKTEVMSDAFATWLFQNLGVADSISDDGLFTVKISSKKMEPRPRQWSVWFVVATAQTRIRKTVGQRIGPTGPHRVDEGFVADNAGMRLVRSVEGNAFPIDKLIPCPCRCHPHGVVIVE